MGSSEGALGVEFTIGGVDNLFDWAWLSVESRRVVFTLLVMITYSIGRGQV